MPVTTSGLSATPFSSWLLGGLNTPLQNSQPATKKGKQRRAKESSSALPAGTPDPAGRDIPGLPRKSGRAGGGDGARHRHGNGTELSVTGRDGSASPGPTVTYGRGGRGYHGDRAEPGPVPGHIAMTTPAPFPTMETLPDSCPLTWGGRRTRPQHIPGGGTGRGAPGTGDGGASATGHRAATRRPIGCRRARDSQRRARAQRRARPLRPRGRRRSQNAGGN